jgi:hypothetical protein
MLLDGGLFFSILTIGFMLGLWRPSEHFVPPSHAGAA